MRHTIKLTLFTVSAFLMSISASACDFEVDGIFYNILSPNDFTCEVTYGGRSNSSALYTGDLTIPSTIVYMGWTFSIISIGDHAFNGCTSLTSVSIPNSVTTISDNAFSGCTSLTSVSIPQSVASISPGAFDGCTGLTDFIVEEGNKNFSSSDGLLLSVDKDTLVAAPAGLSFIEIPNSVRSIGVSAFSSTSLTSVVIPNSVTSIGEAAFWSCKKLESVDIPNSVTSIGDAAFWSCKKLGSVDIPNSVTSIGDYAFAYCESLDKLTISNGVVSINDHTFAGCSSLISLKIPNSVISIGNSAFRDCSGITSLEIPNSVTTIWNDAFGGCSLKSVIIPNSVTNIYGGGGISGCKVTKAEVGNFHGLSCVTNERLKTLILAEDYSDANYSFNYDSSCYPDLDSLICKRNVPPMLPIIFNEQQYMNVLVVVPSESLSQYQEADIWKDFWHLQGGAENFTANDIDAVCINNSNKRCHIYDLQGRRMKTPQQGINIINGKKVLVVK